MHTSHFAEDALTTREREREREREKAEQTLLIQYIHSIYPQPKGISSIRNLSNVNAVTSDPLQGGR
jgi:hypothetical protein